MGGHRSIRFAALFSALGCDSADDSAPVVGVLPCSERVGGSCGEAGDTGTGWLVWHGSIAHTENELQASRGFAAKNLATGEYVCDLAVHFAGSTPAASLCPDCAWAYDVRVDGGGTTGDYCDAFLTRGTLFETASVDDFYFGSSLDGIGFSPVYLYSGANGTYALESVVWAHLDAPVYDGWYIYGYNYPAGGVYHVRGTEAAATVEQYARSSAGVAYYYYVAY